MPFHTLDGHLDDFGEMSDAAPIGLFVFYYWILGHLGASNVLWESASCQVCARHRHSLHTWIVYIFYLSAFAVLAIKSRDLDVHSEYSTTEL